MKYRLYHGSSPYLSLKSAHTYLKKIREESNNQEFLSIDADSTDSSSLLDLVSSQNLFFANRIIFLRRVYRNKEKDKILEQILGIIQENNSSDTIIFWEDQKIKANTKYFKFFDKYKAVEESNATNKRTFFTWLRKELEELDLKIEATALRELAERTNYDPERCSNELKKIKLLIDDREIKKSDIENVISNTLEKDIWALVDAINSADKIESIFIVEKLITQAVDPNYIISMIARNLRLITLVKFLTEEKNETQSNIAKILKIPPFTIPQLIRTAKEYDRKKIKMLYTKLANLDYQIKKGLIDPKLGITLLSSIL